MKTAIFKMITFSTMAFVCFYTSLQVCRAEIVSCPNPNDFKFVENDHGSWNITATALGDAGTNLVFTQKDAESNDIRKFSVSALRVPLVHTIYCRYQGDPNRSVTYLLVNNEQRNFEKCKPIADGKFDCKFVP